MPVMTEPLICPWWPMGLTMVPMSWAVVKLRSLTSPVSGSTETSAHWAAKQVLPADRLLQVGAADFVAREDELVSGPAEVAGGEGEQLRLGQLRRFVGR